MRRNQSILIILAISTITVLAIWRISYLKFDYDFEKFFPVGNEESDFYFDFRKKFETDNDFIIVGLVNQKGAFDSLFLSKADSLTKILRTIPDMAEVVSPTDMTEVMRDPVFGGIFKKPVLSWQDGPEALKSDSARVLNHELYKSTFFSPDGTAIAINMKHKQGLSKKACDDIAVAVQNALAPFDFDESHIIGRSLGQKIYVETMAREMIIFITISLILTIVFLLVAFRSFWNILLPTLVVLIAIVWTLGAVEILGHDIDIMLTILPTILFVIGMSDSVHILSRYLELLRKGLPKQEAIKQSIRDTILPTFLTAITTSIGFGTLIYNSIEPVSHFGTYISLGVLLAFCISYLLLPAGLSLVPPPSPDSRLFTNDFWTPRLHKWFRWILRNRKRLLWSLPVVVLAFGFIASTIRVNNFMLEDLENDHFLKQEFRFVEEKFSGARPFEMAIQLDQGTDLWNSQTLRTLDSLDQFLRNQYGVGAMVSIPAIVKSAHKSLNGGQEGFYNIPDSSDIKSIQKLLKRKEFSEALALVYHEESKTLRFTGKVGDLGRDHFEKKNSELNQFTDQLKNAGMTFRVTGTAHLIDYNNAYLVENMLFDIILSILAVALVVGLMFGSLRTALLTLVPNVIPLAGIAAFMALAGIDIKISTSIIFNIAFGIAVDDTIHFMGKLKLLQMRGYRKNYAVKRTFISTGKAIILTTLILCAGFVSLIFSSFMGTFYVGLLVTLTLLMALVADLLYSPVLVLTFGRDKKLRQRSKRQTLPEV